MKLFNGVYLLLTGILFISAVEPDTETLNLSKDYSVSINGTSNLHDWNEKVGTVSGNGSLDWNKDGSFDLILMKIKMEVNSIKSDEGSIMNNNTYKALKAETNPEITFTLKTAVRSIPAVATNTTIAIKGSLTIAGVTKPVDMQVKIFMQGHLKLSFEGSQSIKMTDYGIDPPVALFGALKTGDQITISFKTNFTDTGN